ncbi:hypothetical protein SEPCBS57363_005938 [Sporothrix epigloea]|uniref:Small secreted protein n=1 Tax=Sporothrix epigloea TaxID=1892477 RepID=A0ABP0E2R2_9PEZI
MFNLFNLLPLALMASTAFSNPVPEVTNTTELDARILGNDATYLICITDDFRCGFFATYTNGQTRQTVKWTTGNPSSSNPQVFESNEDWCTFSAYRKHTNDAGFWYNADFHFHGASHTIGYNPTGKSINLGPATWGSRDADYLNGRCLNEFGGEYKPISTNWNSAELNWQSLGEELY